MRIIINTNIKALVDKESVEKVISDLSEEQMKDVSVKDIQWRIGDVTTKDNDTYITLVAVGIKPKIQFSDVELQELLEQSSAINLSDLYAERFHTDVSQRQILEIKSNPFPNGTPLLHKE